MLTPADIWYRQDRRARIAKGIPLDDWGTARRMRIQAAWNVRRKRRARREVIRADRRAWARALIATQEGQL